MLVSIGLQSPTKYTHDYKSLLDKTKLSVEGKQSWPSLISWAASSLWTLFSGTFTLMPPSRTLTARKDVSKSRLPFRRPCLHQDCVGSCRRDGGREDQESSFIGVLSKSRVGNGQVLLATGARTEFQGLGGLGRRI